MGVPTALEWKGPIVAFEKPAFESVDVPPAHPIFRGSGLSPQIAEKIDMPLFTREVVQSAQQLKDDDYNDANQTATFLHLQIKDCSGSDAGDDLGWAPMYWQNGVGTVLVVCQDKQPLTLQDVEVLCHWCRFKLAPLFGEASERDNGEDTATNIFTALAEITRAKFEAYKKGFV